MRRVHVVGTSGSGKSTLAVRLAAALGVPRVELDALYWRPGWVAAPPEELRAAVAAAVAGDGWVVDGNYASLRDLVWPRAEVVVWLDLPRSTVMRQVLWRTAARRWSRELLWGVNRESLRKTLFTRDSIVWWAWSTHAARRREYEALLPTAPVPIVRLRSRAEVEAWLAGVRAGAAPPG